MPIHGFGDVVVASKTKPTKPSGSDIIPGKDAILDAFPGAGTLHESSDRTQQGVVKTLGEVSRHRSMASVFSEVPHEVPHGHVFSDTKPSGVLSDVLGPITISVPAPESLSSTSASSTVAASIKTEPPAYVGGSIKLLAPGSSNIQSDRDYCFVVDPLPEGALVVRNPGLPNLAAARDGFKTLMLDAHKLVEGDVDLSVPKDEQVGRTRELDSAGKIRAMAALEKAGFDWFQAVKLYNVAGQPELQQLLWDIRSLEGDFTRTMAKAMDQDYANVSEADAVRILNEQSRATFGVEMGSLADTNYYTTMNAMKMGVHVSTSTVKDSLHRQNLSQALAKTAENFMKLPAGKEKFLAFQNETMGTSHTRLVGEFREAWGIIDDKNRAIKSKETELLAQTRDQIIELAAHQEEPGVRGDIDRLLAKLPLRMQFELRIHHFEEADGTAELRAKLDTMSADELDEIPPKLTLQVMNELYETQLAVAQKSFEAASRLEEHGRDLLDAFTGDPDENWAKIQAGRFDEIEVDPTKSISAAKELIALFENSMVTDIPSADDLWEIYQSGDMDTLGQYLELGDPIEEEAILYSLSRMLPGTKGDALDVFKGMKTDFDQKMRQAMIDQGKALLFANEPYYSTDTVNAVVKFIQIDNGFRTDSKGTPEEKMERFKTQFPQFKDDPAPFAHAAVENFGDLTKDYAHYSHASPEGKFLFRGAKYLFRMTFLAENALEKGPARDEVATLRTVAAQLQDLRGSDKFSDSEKVTESLQLLRDALGAQDPASSLSPEAFLALKTVLMADDPKPGAVVDALYSYSQAITTHVMTESLTLHGK